MSNKYHINEGPIFSWPQNDPVMEVFPNGRMKTYGRLSVMDYEEIMEAMAQRIVDNHNLMWNNVK